MAIQLNGLNSVWLNKWYLLLDFECPCCHQVKIAASLLKAASALSTALDYKFSFSSAYRCPSRNYVVGGVKNSWHTKGLAIDGVLSSTGISQAKSLIVAAGFTEIIYYSDRLFWHLACPAQPVEFLISSNSKEQKAPRAYSISKEKSQELVKSYKEQKGLQI